MTARPVRWNALAGAIIVAAAITYAILWRVAYLAPDLSWDGNWYHLPPIHLWALHGGPYWIDDAMPYSGLMNGYPHGAELLAYLVVSATGDSNLVACANLLFLPIGIASIAYLSRVFGASKIMAVAAGCAFVLVPTVIGQCVTTYVDVAFACSIMAVLACFVHSYFDAIAILYSQNRTLIKNGLMCGLACGLAFSVKATAVALVPVIVAVWIVAVIAGRVRFRRIAAVLLPCAIVTVLIGGYWYARNVVHTGNPIYPFAVTVAGHRFAGLTRDEILPPALATPVLRGRPIWWQLGYSWVSGWRLMPWSGYTYDTRIGGLGWFWPLACLPCILAQSVYVWRCGRGTRQRGAWAFLGLSTALMLVAMPMAWWSRFTLWLYGLGLPAFAACVRRAKWPARLYIVACVAVLIAQSGATLYTTQDFGWYGALTTGWLNSDRCTPQLLADCIAPAPLTYPLNLYTPVAVGPLGGSVRVPGALMRPIGTRRVVALGDPTTAIPRLRAQRVWRIVLDKREVGTLRTLYAAGCKRDERCDARWKTVIVLDVPSEKKRSR
jgi:hypothetical protein